MNSKCNLRYNDCYYDGTGHCWRCTHNENAEKKEEDEYISNLDKVNELFHYLIDKEIPKGIEVKSRPKLSPNKAWNLIWFLQEVTHCLPTNIERCDVCGELYDSDAEGYYLYDDYEVNGKTLPAKYWGHYCSDECAPRFDFQLK